MRKLIMLVLAFMLFSGVALATVDNPTIDKGRVMGTTQNRSGDFVIICVDGYKVMIFIAKGINEKSATALQLLEAGIKGPDGLMGPPQPVKCE